MTTISVEYFTSVSIRLQALRRIDRTTLRAYASDILKHHAVTGGIVTAVGDVSDFTRGRIDGETCTYDISVSVDILQLNRGDILGDCKIVAVQPRLSTVYMTKLNGALGVIMEVDDVAQYRVGDTAHARIVRRSTKHMSTDVHVLASEVSFECPRWTPHGQLFEIPETTVVYASLANAENIARLESLIAEFPDLPNSVPPRSAACDLSAVKKILARLYPRSEFVDAAPAPGDPGVDVVYVAPENIVAARFAHAPVPDGFVRTFVLSPTRYATGEIYAVYARSSLSHNRAALVNADVAARFTNDYILRALQTYDTERFCATHDEDWSVAAGGAGDSFDRMFCADQKLTQRRL